MKWYSISKKLMTNDCDDHSRLNLILKSKTYSETFFAKNMHWNKNLQHFGILTLVLSISNDFITSLFWKYQMQLCYTAALNKINCYRNHFIWKHVRILNCSKCSFNLSLIQAKMGQTMRFWWEGQPVTIMWELSTLGKLSRFSFTWSKDM